MTLRLTSEFHSSLRREVHHHFIKAVDRRVVLPVDSRIHIFRVALSGNSPPLCFPAFLIFRYEANRCLRFGQHTPCRTSFLRRLFLVGGSFLLAHLPGHAPEVEQGELHTFRMFRSVRFNLRLFFRRMRVLRVLSILCYGVCYGCSSRSRRSFNSRIFHLRRMQAVPVIPFPVQT